jgi:hypothetical protein
MLNLHPNGLGVLSELEIELMGSFLVISGFTFYVLQVLKLPHTGSLHYSALEVLTQLVDEGVEEAEGLLPNGGYAIPQPWECLLEHA